MTTKAHSTLTGSDLHEPKGIGTATSGQVYVANGSSSGAWTTLSTTTAWSGASHIFIPGSTGFTITQTGSPYLYDNTTAPGSTYYYKDTSAILTFATTSASVLRFMYQFTVAGYDHSDASTTIALYSSASDTALGWAQLPANSYGTYSCTFWTTAPSAASLTYHIKFVSDDGTGALGLSSASRRLLEVMKA